MPHSVNSVYDMAKLGQSGELRMMLRRLWRDPRDVLAHGDCNGVSRTSASGHASGSLRAGIRATVAQVGLSNTLISPFGTD